MKINILKHQVRDNLFVVSTDIYKMLNRKGEPQHFMKNLFDNKSEIVEDRWLPAMTMMLPDRVYFDEKFDKTLEDMKVFAESYLKN